MNERESGIEAWLVNRIKDIGGVAYKFVSPGNDGVPDRIVVLPDGRIIFVELKAQAGKLSALQKSQIRRLRGMGADVRIIRGRAEAELFIYQLEGGYDAV